MTLNTTFSKPTTQKAVLFTVFLLLELFFSHFIVVEVSHYIVVAVAKENLLDTSAIVLLANFQCI